MGHYYPHERQTRVPLQVRIDNDIWPSPSYPNTLQRRRVHATPSPLVVVVTWSRYGSTLPRGSIETLSSVPQSSNQLNQVACRDPRSNTECRYHAVVVGFRESSPPAAVRSFVRYLHPLVRSCLCRAVVCILRAVVSSGEYASTEIQRALSAPFVLAEHWAILLPRPIMVSHWCTPKRILKITSHGVRITKETESIGSVRQFDNSSAKARTPSPVSVGSLGDVTTRCPQRR